MIVISDTTPILSLIKIDRLKILEELYKKIIIPKAVYDELIINIDYQDEIDIIKRCTFIQIENVEENLSVVLLQRELKLDRGESEAIVLAKNINADLIIIDERKGKRTAEAVINELIRGPKSSKLSRTVPQESKLRSIKVESGVVYVNFSKEFQAKHSGGSAGETMTLYSITNSLAELPGVNKVQFLLEGKKVNSILGHTSTTTPLAPNWSLVEK
jgi:predicted nucleic acid-binding protein